MTVFAAAAPQELDARAALADRIATSLTVGAAMLALALAVVVALIRRPPQIAAVPAREGERNPTAQAPRRPEAERRAA